MADLELKNYLLGNLDAQTDEQIGVQILEDDSLDEKLLIAEYDLIEDFLDKNLSPVEEKLFYENFLICDNRQKKINEISLYRQVAKKHFQTEDAAGHREQSSDSFFDGIKKLFGFNIGFAVPVLAVLILVLAGFYFFNSTEKMSPLENEFATLNRQDFADVNQFSRFSNVSLIAGTFRDSSVGNKLKAENLSGKIFFRLALPFEQSQSELLNAEIIRDQKTVFRQNEIRIYKNQNGQEIRLLLPKEIVSKGQYQLKIINPKNENAAVTYNFAVE